MLPQKTIYKQDFIVLFPNPFVLLSVTGSSNDGVHVFYAVTDFFHIFMLLSYPQNSANGHIQAPIDLFCASSDFMFKTGHVV